MENQEFREKKLELALLTKKAMGLRKQGDFAKECGMGRSYLNQLLKEKLPNIPKASTLMRIARNSNGNVTEKEILKAAGYAPEQYIREIDFDAILEKYYNESDDHTSSLYEHIKDKLFAFNLIPKSDIGSIDPEEYAFSVRVKNFIVNNWDFVYWFDSEFEEDLSDLDEHLTKLFNDINIKYAYKEPSKLSIVTSDPGLYKALSQKEYPGLGICVSIILTNLRVKGPIFETYLKTAFTKALTKTEKINLFNKLTFHSYLVGNSYGIETYTIDGYKAYLPYEFNPINIDPFDKATYIYSLIQDTSFYSFQGISIFSKNKWNDSYKNKLIDEQYITEKQLETEDLKEALIYDIGVNIDDFQNHNCCIMIPEK